MLGLVFGVIGLVFRASGWAVWLVYRAIRWTGWLVWNLLRLVVIAIRDILLALGRFVTAVVMLPWRSTRPDDSLGRSRLRPRPRVTARR